MKKPLTIGRVARTLLKFYENYGWTQSAYARSGGETVSVHNPQADSFCLLGAIRRMTLCLESKHSSKRCLGTYLRACSLLREALGSVLFFNDNNTQEVVFEKLRELSRLP